MKTTIYTLSEESLFRMFNKVFAIGLALGALLGLAVASIVLKACGEI